MKAYLRLKWSVALVLVFLMCTGVTHSFAYNISQTYYSSTSITPFNPRTRITAFGISGSVTLNSDSSMVRVLLEATDGTQYLVYEATPMLLNGMSDSFTNANEETFSLNGIRPRSVKLIITDASLYISETISTIYQAGSFNMPPSNELDSLRRFRVQEKVNQINAYNQSHSKYWTAGVTSLSMLSYEDKLRTLGNGCDILDTEGFEYYVGGIFEFSSRRRANHQCYDYYDSPYVQCFDWRNRHGMNWNTFVKDQGISGYCFAFSPVAAFEVYINLHYNDTINLDLSEEDVAIYSKRSDHKNDITAWNGGYLFNACDYVTQKGVAFESDIPFQNFKQNTYPDNRASSLAIVKAKSNNNIFPGSYLVTSSSSEDVLYQRVDSLKHALITRGPLASGIINKKNNQGIAHSMCLVGYKVVEASDTISIVKNDGFFKGFSHSSYIAPYIGKLIWVFKDSYGTDSENGGYKYFYFHDYDILQMPQYFQGVDFENFSPNYVTNVCDRDGDGYYTWGLGQPKPNTLPSWVPDEQDGDDSDSSKGPMNEYGHLLDLSYQPSDTIYINTDTEISGFQYLTTPIVVRNGATLTISGTLKCNSNGSIYVRNNSHLIVSESMLYNINLVGENGSDIRIDADSSVNISQDTGNYITLHR